MCEKASSHTSQKPVLPPVHAHIFLNYADTIHKYKVSFQYVCMWGFKDETF